MSHRNRMRVASSVIIVLALFRPLMLGAGPSNSEGDIWKEFRPLVGKWNGEGKGFGSVSDISHVWEFVLEERFLKLQTRSVVQQEGKSGEIHEDIGILSWDSDRSVFVFRQFLSEGFVNTYDVRFDADEKLTIVFAHREAESAGGMRARMRLTLLSGDEYEMVLDLAPPGKEFAPCQQMHMKKAQ